MSIPSKKFVPDQSSASFFHFDQLFSWKTSFWLLALISLMTMPALSLGYGIIWDEWIQSHYGKLVLKFFLTFGQDRSALQFGETMYLYGGLFDLLTAGIYGLFFDSLKNVANYPLQSDYFAPHWHDVRHIVNSLFGFTAILFTGLTARRIAGWRAATLAFIFLLLSPRFFGNAMNNPKDIPFAAGAAIFTFFIIKLIQELPKPSRQTKFGTAMGIALAINIKAGGLLFLCYLWLFMGITWLQSQKSSADKLPILQMIKVLLFISTGAYFGGVLFWPYGLLNPLLHPVEAMLSFSKFSGAQGQLLFEGTIFNHGSTPWYYLPKWILISSPLFLIVSIFIFGIISKPLFKKHSPLILGLLLFCTIFPLAYAIAGKSVVYDSWRHFLFVYPPLIVLAAVAWDFFIDQCEGLFKKNLLVIILLLFLAEPLIWMMRNHPNEYVYFNSLVGGLRGAYGHYETDYWGNCLRPASEALLRDYQAKNTPSSVVIRSDGESISSVPFLVKGLGQFYVPFKEGKNEWKYSLEFSRSRDPQSLTNGKWPGPNAIATVSADDIPLCSVIEKK